MTRSKVIWKNVFILAVAGGLAFWLANFAISRTPIAAEYRAALTISYFPMLLEALIGGLLIAFCVSYFLLRFLGQASNKASDFKIRDPDLHRPGHCHDPDRRTLKLSRDRGCHALFSHRDNV